MLIKFDQIYTCIAFLELHNGYKYLEMLDNYVYMRTRIKCLNGIG